EARARRRLRQGAGTGGTGDLPRRHPRRERARLHELPRPLGCRHTAALSPPLEPESGVHGQADARLQDRPAPRQRRHHDRHRGPHVGTADSGGGRVPRGPALTGARLPQAVSRRRGKRRIAAALPRRGTGRRPTNPAVSATYPAEAGGTSIADFCSRTQAGAAASAGKSRVTGAQPMLSHIVTLMREYERHHGVRPNVVFMNETHYGYLREELPFVRDHDEVIAILGVDIALNDDAMNPQAATVRFAAENILVS